ncbi:U2 snRNP complex subunit [Coemansia sp. RSA 2705]|nr:U2 snRNP complex subunit [Coemansia sp. RSA 2705]
MKLTADLIANSPATLNAIKEYELDLSGNHISHLENLGATRNRFDALNLCNNTVRVLGNFPELPRLQSLYAADNKVSAIDRDLARSLPALHTLVLSDNEIAELVDLEPLRELAELRMLSLANNPVMARPHARLWCVWRMPALRILDFERVSMAERAEARRLFGSPEDMSALAKTILDVESTANTFVPGEGLDEPEVDLDKQQSIAELKARIRQEMAQVEAMEQFL